MTTWKQPHEDIRGVQRDDLLLSLDPAALTHRDALIGMAHHLHTATLVGDPAPIVKRMYDRIRNPHVGDLVVETSGSMDTRDEARRFKAFGILVEVRREWWETDAEWEATRAEDPDAERATDKAWYVQYGPRAVDICRWVDCSFLVLPIGEWFDADNPGIIRDGRSVTVTRDGLLGSLADSGFDLAGGAR